MFKLCCVILFAQTFRNTFYLAPADFPPTTYNFDNRTHSVHDTLVTTIKWRCDATGTPGITYCIRPYFSVHTSQSHRDTQPFTAMPRVFPTTDAFTCVPCLYLYICMCVRACVCHTYKSVEYNARGEKQFVVYNFPLRSLTPITLYEHIMYTPPVRNIGRMYTTVITRHYRYDATTVRFYYYYTLHSRLTGTRILRTYIPRTTRAHSKSEIN